VASFRKAGYRIAVSSVCPSAVPLCDVDLTTPVVLVFGNENSGCSQQLIETSDVLFTIPMVGVVESVNVSVSCAVVASQTTERCRGMGRSFMEDIFLLKPHEQQELYHKYLAPQPIRRAVQPSRKMFSKFDVTRIGSVAERVVARNSMFAQTVDDKCADVSSYMTEKFRLSSDGGIHMSRYFVRRAKVGALGDGKFDKRCQSIALAVTGLTALSCEGAVAVGSTTESSVGLRFKLVTAIRKIVSAVNGDYAQIFDAASYPTLPLHAPESAAVVAEIRSQYVCHAWSAAIEYFEQHDEDISEADVKELVRNASVFDIAMCLSDTARCGRIATSALVDIAASASTTFPELTTLLANRERERDVFIVTGLLTADTSSAACLTDKERLVLQVLLRLTHCADIVSSLHTCAWEKEIGVGSRRVLSTRYGLVESIIVDGFAELDLLGAPERLKLARGLYEWTAILHTIKKHIDA
jgi:hypothetical protein